MSVEVQVGTEAVWEAISTGDGLRRWFAPIAAVEPGEGGKVTVAWSEGGEWAGRIVKWEPEVCLRQEDELPEGAGEQAQPTTLEYQIEPLPKSKSEPRETTRLRIVNAGFSSAPEWEPFIKTMENGWRFFLWNLKHALERHPGLSRTMISDRPWVSGSREKVWDVLLGNSGLGCAPPSKGDVFVFELDGGLELKGTTVLSDRPAAFAGKVESLNDGVLHVEMEGDGDERWKMGIWLSVYGVPEERCRKLQEALNMTVARLFG